MRRLWGGKLLALCAACGLLAALSLVTSPMVGQDATGKPVKKEGEKKERAEPRGRLPNFYSDVVTEEQREKIYAIQKKYAEELEDLTEQLKALANDGDAEISALLTPEQRDKVAKAAAEAKAKRIKAAEEKKLKKEASKDPVKETTAKEPAKKEPAKAPATETAPKKP